jgi:ankyrin repeat protein
MGGPEIYNAAVFGRYDRVRAILATDPEAVHTRDEYGFTVLHGVAGEDHPDMIRLLVDAGADVNAGNDMGHTPLHLAANVDAVRVLVTAGADVNARSLDGSTPLHLAVEEPGRVGVVEALLAAGAEVGAVNARGRTPLDIAVARGENAKITLLQRFSRGR